MNDFELQILVKVRAELEQLTKIKQELQDIPVLYDAQGNVIRKVADETKKLGQEQTTTNKKGVDGIMGVTRAIRGMLQPLILIRRTVFAIGLVWGLTAGLVIGAIATIRKKQEELNDISIITGKSVESLSERMYGINIASEKARTGVTALMQAQNFLARMWTVISTKTTEVVGNVKLAIDTERIYQDLLSKRIKTGAIVELPKQDTLDFGFLGKLATQSLTRSIRMTAEEEKALRKEANEIARRQAEEQRQKMNADTKEAILLRGELNQKILQLQGRELQGFKASMDATRSIYVQLYGENGEITRLFDEFYKMQEEQMRNQLLGLKENYQIMRDLVVDITGAMRNSFQSFFSDVFQGKLRTAREYFYSFVTDLANAWSKMLADMMVNSLVGKTGLGGLLGGLIGLPGSPAIPGFGGYGSNTPAGVINMGTYSTLPGRAGGGWAGLNGPEVSVLGESGPELVLNQNQLSRFGGSGSSTQVYYYINAIDASSFNDLVLRNPESIVSVTQRSIEKNKSIRRTIKNFA